MDTVKNSVVTGQWLEVCLLILGSSSSQEAGALYISLELFGTDYMVSLLLLLSIGFTNCYSAHLGLLASL